MKVLNSSSYKFLTVLLIIFLLQFSDHQIFAQKSTKDTVPNSLVKIHSPKIATICSAIVPGLGQVYNRKIWKVPIIYISLGALMYYFDYNNTKYKFYKDAALKNNTLYIGGGTLSGSGLIYYRDLFRRYRDLNAIGIIVMYVLNIVDANVDANLFDFDVSDDLTFRVEPAFQKIGFQKNNALGLACKIKF